MDELEGVMDFDYLSPDYITHILFHTFNTSPTFLPSVFFLVMARLLPIVSLVPFLGARVLPRPAKVGLALSLFFVAFPFVIEQITVPVSFNVTLVFLLLKEAFIGFSISIVILVPFAMAQTAGIFLDHQRGAASLQVNDPIVQNMASPMGVFFDLLSVYLFFTFNGPFLFFDTVIESFQLMPPDKFLSVMALSHDAPFWELPLSIYSTIVISGVKLASPALIVILMTDTFLGIANRLAPQVQMVFLGMPLKALFGIGIVWVGWTTMVRYIGNFAMSWLDQITILVHNLGLGL